ncbi:MAG: UDP-N-acetylmuramoyl-L-alanine--D-glutamate ligase [Alphaproteobacteria bacterium]
MTVALDMFRNKPVAVLGLARSGRATLAALRAGGARGIGWDDNEAARAAAASEGHEVAPPEAWPWSDLAALVPSPGVPMSHPLFACARAAGTPVLGDVELLARAQPEARVVGITGTNGKSTTTALTAHIARYAGLSVEVGGNLGTPPLALAPLGAGGTYVLELSSFQLDLTTDLSLDIAVLLNITPDHLDRHGGIEGYIAAKRKIMRPGRLRTAIVGIDDAPSRAIADSLAGIDGVRVVPVTVGAVSRVGVSVAEGRLYDSGRGVFDLRAAEALPGAHNWQNAAAAYAVARALDIGPTQIATATLGFPGLAHRIETIATIDGVRFVNDSKATNADAAARALACFENVYWIAGGLPKAGGIASLAPFFERIARAYLIGEAEAEFAATLEGRVPYRRCGTLASAIEAAREDARRDGRAAPVVLLSPACASYDQFANFEARGEAFRTLVTALSNHAAPGPERSGAPLRRAAP